MDADPQPARSRAPRDQVTAGAWFDVRRRQDQVDAVAELSGKAVVLLGESHDDPAHHVWQRDTLGALFARRPNLAVGFEMFPRRVQPVLDRWSRGELDEAGFLAAVDWPRIWGGDPGLYLPLLRFAQLNGLPVIALNVERATSRAAGAKTFAGLAAAEREGVGEPAPATAAYRDRLLTWFKQHPRGDADPVRFERFVRVQLFWDRAMAEALASALRGLGRPLVIGIMGSGHVEYGDGVAHQLAALGESDVAAALPWPAGTECPVSDPPVADYLFGVVSAADIIPV